MKWNSFDFNHASHNFHLTIALSRYDVQVNIDWHIGISCLSESNMLWIIHLCWLVSNGPWSDRDRSQDRDSGSGHRHGADVCTHWPRLSAAASPGSGSGDNKEKAGTRHKVPLVILLLHNHYTTAAALQSHAAITPGRDQSISKQGQVRDPEPCLLSKIL